MQASLLQNIQKRIQQIQAESQFLVLKKGISIVLCVAILLEIILFPAMENVAGCVMTFICWVVFSAFFFNKAIILKHTFAFLMFLSMFLYRFIPLFATLAENKPITYGFENAFQTFFFETLLFLLSCGAFYCACLLKKDKPINPIQKGLIKFGFFKKNTLVFWIMGMIGLLVNIYIFAQGKADYGDAGGKFLDGIKYLQYAPCILAFPSLLGLKVNNKQKTILWSYIVFLFILSFVSNSRKALITPIATIGVLYLLSLMKTIPLMGEKISLVKILLIGVIGVYLLGIMSDVSLAMLANRGIRGDISKSELFQRTWDTFQDKEELKTLKSIAEAKEDDNSKFGYSSGWTEGYIDNFMLNRYGNMRITDQTIYYANLLGWGNKDMQHNSIERVFALLPMPMINLLGLKIDKESLFYSAGDYLYYKSTGVSSALGELRVTSHVGDGLATWDLWYFPLQFFLFYLEFLLLDCFLINLSSSITIYSPYGLMNLFGFVGMFRNAGGCVDDLSYILRGFWQGCFTYLVIFSVVSFFVHKVLQR